MASLKKRLIVVVLPILTVLFVLCYGFREYREHHKISGKPNSQHHSSSSQNMTNLERLDANMQANPGYLTAQIDTAVPSSGDIVAVVRSAMKEVMANNLTLSRQSNVNQGQGIGNADKAAAAMVGVAKYIALRDLQNAVTIGSSYAGQVVAIEPFAAHDHALLELLSILRLVHILGDEDIIKEYDNVADKMNEEVYFRSHVPNLINNLLFRVKKYVGVKKEGEDSLSLKVAVLLQKKDYYNISILLQGQSFTDPKMLSFKDSISRRAVVDNMFISIMRSVIAGLDGLADRY